MIEWLAFTIFSLAVAYVAFIGVAIASGGPRGPESIWPYAIIGVPLLFAGYSIYRVFSN